MPLIVRKLAERYEVHYFGMHSAAPVPDLIKQNAILHYLPVYFNRACGRDKVIKTIVWYLAMPFMALRCRFMGVRMVYNDETVPLTAPILRLFFGRNVAITVMDFFLDIYFEKAHLLKPICAMLKRIDVTAWRKLPVIFTKVDYTHEYLAKLGVDRSRIHTIYNPCDPGVFFPADRRAARERWGFFEKDVVLVHHGILHPNKGNDRIIAAIADLRDQLPTLRFLLIGDGAEMQNLKALVGKLNLQDVVIMPGWLPTEADLNLALSASDIGLVMRIGQFTDNFHLTETLSHEMACGLPILAANLKGIAEVIKDGENGCLFDPGDMSEFKSKLVVLTRDRDQRKRFGRSSLKLSAEFCGIERAVEATLQPLLEMIESDAK